jgi:recombination protein RecT
MTATTVNAAVSRREASPVGVMWQSKSHFRAVLPASVDVEAFLGTAAGALYASASQDPKKLTLMRCAESDPDSLVTAMMRCAALGHMPGTDEFYLTPRVVKGRPTVLGIEGYRGIVERMYRSGAVAKVVVREVCAGDKFYYAEGDMDRPLHNFSGQPETPQHLSTGADFFGPQGRRDRGEMVGVYAYAILTTGAVSQVVILTRDDVEAARDSGGYKADDSYSPWNRLDAGKAHPEFTGRSMWWKTAARRLEPWVPTSAEYRREQLRASASAAAQASPAAPPEYPAANGRAAEPQDIHDAEIVPDQPAPRSLKAAHDKLTGILGKLQLGTPEDEKDLIDWVSGRREGEALTSAQIGTVTTFLGDALDTALKSCGGDMDTATITAAKDIWDQYKAVHPPEAP